jgi:hypothetical protein
MSRPIRTTLVLAAIALAIPATALAVRGPAADRLTPRPDPVTIPAAATVASYAGGVLTLTPAAGGQVAGAVTAATRFDCPRTAPTGRGRGFTPPPPCDASLLVGGEQVADADLELTAGGAAFRLLVLLPPPAPVIGNS